MKFLFILFLSVTPTTFAMFPHGPVTREFLKCQDSNNSLLRLLSNQQNTPLAPKEDAHTPPDGLLVLLEQISHQAAQQKASGK